MENILKKIASLHPDTLLEKTPALLLSQDFYDIFKKTSLLLWVTASKISLSRKYLVFLTQRGFY